MTDQVEQPMHDPMTEAEVKQAIKEALDARREALREEVQQAIDAAIAAAMTNVVKVGERIALRAAEGAVLCAEEGGPVVEGQPFTLTARADVALWESWLVERGQG